jgi:chaperonin GroEL (HSP60 family)
MELEFPQANFVAVRAIAAALEPTLGPLSHDKLVVTGLADEAETQPDTPATDEFVITDDGATILEHLPIEHPIAPLLERIIGPKRPGETDVEGADIPDGVTTRAVLAAALLTEAATLLERGLHPYTICHGYERARAVANERLAADRVLPPDFADERAARIGTARTAMTGNDVAGLADRWAELAVDAVDIVGTPDEVSFVVRRTRHGSISDSRLVRGAILDRSERVSREMPRRAENAAVLVLDGHDRGGLVTRETPEGTTASLRSPDAAVEFETTRRERKRHVVDGFVDAGVDVVVTRLGIDRDYQRLLAEHGIFGIRGVTRLDLLQVARATGATPVMDPTDVTAADLGRAGSVEERVIESREGRRKRRRMILFDDCSRPESVAVMFYGVFGRLADQVVTEVRKAAMAVALASGAGGHLPGVVPGGGASHTRVAGAVRRAARETGTREGLAMNAFADAVESLVGTLARNAGLDPLSTIADLRAAHEADRDAAGLVLPAGKVDDCLEAHVLDPVALTRDAYLYATDIATLLLRIDDTLDATFDEEPPGPGESIYDEPAELQQRTLEKREES